MNVVIFGSGGHAKVVADIIEQAKVLRLVGVIDEHLPRGSQWRGYEVLGGDSDLPRLVAEFQIRAAVVAIGDPALRAKIAGHIEEISPTLEFPNAIHPAAVVAPTVRFTRGSVVMAGVVINSDTTIGDFCILNTHFRSTTTE